MSRFKRIKDKSNKKSSVSIDEKIVALNKELEKTGMLSEVMMTTSNVNSTSEYVPPQESIVSPVPDTSGITGADFEQSSAGSGTEGDAPTFSSVSDLFNDTVSATIFPSTNYEGAQGYGVVIGPSFGAGTTYGIIEGGNTYRAVLGGWLAGGTRGSGYYKDIYINKQHANVDNPGTYTTEQIADAKEDWQLAVQVEAILIKIGYDHTLFNKTWKAWRSPILWEDLSSYPVFEGKYLVPFSMLGTANTYAEQEPRPETTTNPQRRGLEDEPIYPGPIPPGLWPPLSPGAFNALKEKARAERERAERERIEKERLEKERLEKERLEKEREEEERKKREEELETWKEAWARRLGVSINFLNKMIYDMGMPFTGMIDDFLKGNTGLSSLDRFADNLTIPVIKTVARLLGVPTPANFMFRYDKWLGSGAKGRVDMTSYIDRGSMRKLSSVVNKLEGPHMKNETIKQQFKRLTSEGKSKEEALDKIATAVQYEVQRLTSAGGTGGKQLSHSIGNGAQIDRKAFIESGGKIIKFSKGYDFAENTGSVSGKSPLHSFVKGLGVELDTTSHGLFFWGTVLAAKYGLKNVNRNYKGSPDRAPQMPYSFKIPSGGGINESFWDNYEWIDLLQVKNDEQVSLQEGVGLGLYEPEAMNVDLADIRKGVMPEYPKKPPAEMIDGYHQDSKLKPKEFKDKYLLKIDEKDLIRNHRLKKGEADEMMNTIKMINDHLKKHPEDLIYVQQRYPIDDPRLAELNWKMDQMLEAGEEYLDKNFKENQTLYKRATDRTKKNIKLTDPEYVQQHYDELRGTIKPKKTKLVGRLGKHLNKYESKSLFKHVNSKNFKKINEQKIERKEQVKQIQKEIKIEFQEKKNDWRKDLGNNTY